MKTAIYYTQYLVVRFLAHLLSALPPAWASSLTGWVLYFIGPVLPISRIARINLALALPQKSKKEQNRILARCWENLGRTLAESLHIHHLAENNAHNPSNNPGWRVIGKAHLEAARQSGRPIIFFSGHLGNWEAMPAILAHYGMEFASFYRAPNNPFIHNFLVRIRRRALPKTGETIKMLPMFAKGMQGARAAMRHIARGRHLGILGDQKMNDGIAVEFFNRPTMTAPAAAALALRYNALIVTGYIWRESPAQLVLQVDPPYDPTQEFGDQDNHSAQSRQDRIGQVMQFLNIRLQGWIEEKPDLWLWLHRRWDKSLYITQKSETETTRERETDYLVMHKKHGRFATDEDD